MMRKVMGVIVLGVILIALGSACVGQTDTSVSALGSKWNSIIERYDLTVVSRVPNGVVPLRINTPGELIRLLQSLESASGATVYVKAPAVSILAQPEASTAIDVIRFHTSYICDLVWRTRFNLWADIYRGSSGSFHWIDSIRSKRVGLTGFHPFSVLSDTWTSHYIYPDRQKARISGGGILNYYLIFQGILTYYSKPVWREVIWYL